MKKIKPPYTCKDCEHKVNCKKEWGKEYNAIIGTHFCRKSWNEFYNIIKQKES